MYSSSTGVVRLVHEQGPEHLKKQKALSHGPACRVLMSYFNIIVAFNTKTTLEAVYGVASSAVLYAKGDT